MHSIPIASSLLTFLDELEYTEAALSADPDGAALAPAFAAEIDGWPAVFQRERDARRQVTRADAIVSVRDASLDRGVMAFGVRALAEVNGDRGATAFRRFFPVAPSEVVRGAARKQCERVRDVIVPEIAKLGAGHALAPFGTLLGGAAAALLAALDDRAKTKGAVALVAHDVEEWKDGVNRLRVTTHAELRKLAADKGYGAKWADAFFRIGSRAVAEPAAETVPALAAAT